MGIPAGGLDTGAEGIKDIEQRKVFGGLGTCMSPCTAMRLKCEYPMER
jgi:hypothetical protein